MKKRFRHSRHATARLSGADEGEAGRLEAWLELGPTKSNSTVNTRFQRTPNWVGNRNSKNAALLRHGRQRW